ncbi:MAG TPA: DNA internalization-related competence protein ComEC/Rec2 [Steroidobacteraceae bacterium]|nr:DNA internalization-related competence protein ComEC/Rec2 [Steroidobacteraceae bacterium]
MEFAIAFLAGVIGTLVLPALPHIGTCVVIASAILACALVCAVALPNRTRIACVLCGVALGFLHASVQAHVYLAERWRTDERVITDLTVDTIPIIRGDTAFFDGITASGLRVRLTSRDGELHPHVGERWHLLLSLRPPRARANPGTVDLERTYFHDRVHALGTVVSASINHRLDGGHRPLDELRERIARHIDARVADRDAAALISALAVGVTGAMSREQWRIFNATGTTHLVAISGLHVTLFAVVAFAAARALWSALLYRWVRWPRETFAAVTGFLAAAAYATLAGLSVPTQRTLIMLAAWLLSRCMARVMPPFHSFALALVIVLLLDAFAPLTAGFWLSFGAMAAIILTTSTRLVRRPALLEGLAVQGGVTLVLIPLTLAAFGSVSLIGPLVNLVAIPALSWVFVPTILIAIALAPIWGLASDAVLRLAGWMHDVGWPWLAAAADIPWALTHASPPIWWYAVAAPCVLISVMPLPLGLRLAPLLAVVPLAAAVDRLPLDGTAEITILDVGEGTAVAVQTSRHVLVYDTGDVYGTDGRAAETVLVPFLRSRGLRRIDMLVLSRLTSPGAPGLTALLAELPVTAITAGAVAPLDLPGAHPCGERAWRWDNVSFRTYAPAAGTCVLTVESRGVRALLSSDLDASAERALMVATNVSAPLVLIPRHGSDAASSAEFTRAVGARWAVVSGRRERNGREKPGITRWRASGAAVLATAEAGAVRFRIEPEKGLIGPMVYRADNRTLWRGSP